MINVELGSENFSWLWNGLMSGDRRWAWPLLPLTSGAVEVNDCVFYRQRLYNNIHDHSPPHAHRQLSIILLTLYLFLLTLYFLLLTLYFLPLVTVNCVTLYSLSTSHSNWLAPHLRRLLLVVLCFLSLIQTDWIYLSTTGRNQLILYLLCSASSCYMRWSITIVLSLPKIDSPLPGPYLSLLWCHLTTAASLLDATLSSQPAQVFPSQPNTTYSLLTVAAFCSQYTTTY